MQFKQQVITSLVIFVASFSLLWTALPGVSPVWRWVVCTCLFYRSARLIWVLFERYDWRHTRNFTFDASAFKGSELVLGHGFKWEPKHVKKLTAFEAARGELPQSHGPRGGVPALQAVGASGRVSLPTAMLTSHVSLEGATGSGKTVLMANLSSQLIHQGEGAVVVVDPKGSTLFEETLEREAARVGRPFKRIVPYFPDRSCKYNPLSSCAKPTEVEARLKPLFPDVRSGFWTSQPLGVVQRVAQMHQALGLFPFELPRLFQDATDQRRLRHVLSRYLAPDYGEPFRGSTPDRPLGLSKIQAAVAQRRIQSELVEKVVKDIAMPEERFEEINGNFAIALSGLVDSDIAPLFQGEDMLTWDEIDAQKMVVLLQTHSLSTRAVGYKIGQLFLQDFQGHMGARYADPTRLRAPITGLVDEVGEMIYPDFRQSVSKIGESGGRLILGWQSEKDIESAIGRAESNVIRANIRTRIYLRVDDDDAAEAISRHSGTCKIRMRQSQAASHNYATKGTRGSQARVQIVDVDVPMIQPKWLSQQPQGEAFMRMNGVFFRFSVPMRSDT